MYVSSRAAVDQRGVGGRWGPRVVRSLLRPPHDPPLTAITPCTAPLMQCCSAPDRAVTPCAAHHQATMATIDGPCA
jgi:hypothetical protein